MFVTGTKDQRLLGRAACYFRVIPAPFAASPTPFPPSSRRCLRCRCGIGTLRRPTRTALRTRAPARRDQPPVNAEPASRLERPEKLDSPRETPSLPCAAGRFVLIGREGCGGRGATADGEEGAQTTLDRHSLRLLCVRYSAGAAKQPVRRSVGNEFVSCRQP